MSEEQQAKTKKAFYAVLAFILWLVTFGLGLECIYALREIFYMIFGYMGGSTVKAERFSLGLVFLLGLGFLVFIIGTAEYHRKRPGTRESWRFLAWTIAIELSIIALYYIL